MGNQVTVKERAGGVYTQDVIARTHKIYADEPESLGGADLGLSPFELVCAGLGACTNITLRMYAKRKDWLVTNIAVDVAYKKSGIGADMKDVFTRKITLEGDLDGQQIQRMMTIAGKCPVHKMLESDNEIITKLV